jgi:hypothetical protein
VKEAMRDAMSDRRGAKRANGYSLDCHAGARWQQNLGVTGK